LILDTRRFERDHSVFVAEFRSACPYCVTQYALIFRGSYSLGVKHC